MFCSRNTRAGVSLCVCVCVRAYAWVLACVRARIYISSQNDRKIGMWSEFKAGHQCILSSTYARTQARTQNYDEC